MKIDKNLFGKFKGEDIEVYTLTADSGMSVSVITLGATMQKLMVPDREGKLDDIIGGFDDPNDYNTDGGYHGATVGRVCNRIKAGKFTLDGVEYQLPKNQEPNHLHGGHVGFSHKIWSAEPALYEDACSVVLRYTSPDGEEGYPGKLDVKVTYTLKNDNTLSINFNAVTDKKTIVNMTNHSHFNLGGYASGKVLDHEIWLDVESYTEVDESLAPTGKNIPVAGTIFDFTTPKTIGRDFDPANPLISATNGYDHSLNFVKREDPMSAPRGRAYEPKSGRVMELYTDQPAVQLLMGNYLSPDNIPFKGGVKQSYYSLFCMEAQKMPDSINHENFTDTTLDVGKVYDKSIVLKFSVK